MCQHLAREAQDLEAAALPALDALTTKVDTQSLERVRRVKTRLVRLKTRVSAVRPPPPPTLLMPSANAHIKPPPGQDERCLGCFVGRLSA